MKQARLAAALGALVVAGAHRAGDLSGRGTLTYDAAQTGGRSSSSLLQIYELRLARRPTDTISYRLQLHFEDDDGTTAGALGAAAVHSLLLQPSVELSLTPGVAALHLGWDVTAGDVTIGAATSSRRLERGRADLQVRQDGLPVVALRADRRTARDVGAGVDTADDSVEGSIDWVARGLHLSQIDRLSEHTDALTGFRRRAVDVGGQLELQQRFAGDRGVASAGWRSTWTGMEETSAGGAVSAPLGIDAVTALYSVDDTPLSSADRPMSSVPALVDHAPGATGISLGPLSSSFQNLGLDMGRVVELDEIWVEVRDPSGQPVRSGGRVGFSVYTSADAVTWVLADAAPAMRFDPVLSVYRVPFLAHGARYFKLVSFGVNDVETVVTELWPYDHRVFTASERRTSGTWIHSGTGTASFRPVRAVSLTWNGVANFYRSRPDGAPAAGSQDWTQALAASWDPLRLVGLDARYELRRATSTGGFVQDSTIATVGARLTPLPALQTAVAASRQTDRNGISAGLPVETSTDTLSLHQLAQLTPAVDLALDGAWGRQVRTADGASTDRIAGSATARLGLTPALLLSLVTALQRQGSLDPTVPAAYDERSYAELGWRPSVQLAVSGRAGYVQGATARGPLSQLRLQWSPFPDGAIRIATAYDQDLDLALGQRLRRLALSPRWAMNPHTTFDLSLLLEERWSAAAGSVSAGSLFATLTFTL